MFGIVWGISSVILLVGLGIGFSHDQHDRLKSIGTDIAICFGGKTAMPSGGYAAGRDIQLNVDDAIAIQQLAPLVKPSPPRFAAPSARSASGMLPAVRPGRVAPVPEFSLPRCGAGTPDDRRG